MKKRNLLWIGVPAFVLLGAMLYLLITGEQQAGNVRAQVVRFHVVAHSDAEEDQQLKLKVRDGVFQLLERLFADCKDQQQALATAEAHREELTKAAEEILRAEGSSDSVTLEIGERFFPTKTYGSLSFPAGTYQAVSLRIGEAEGKNFWCVLYPALCLAPAVADETAADEMAATVGEDGVSFLKKSDEKQQIRFALVEWFENFKQKYLKT